MKKQLLLFSSIALLANSAWAAVGDTFAVGDVTYKITSDNTVGISDITGSATELPLTEKVTNEGVEYTVTSVEDYSFQYCDATTITLPNTITSIGDNAFSSAKATSIALPSNLKTIGDYAFYACRKLTSIEIPEGVTEIGVSTRGSVFGACESLASIKFPSTLKKIWNSSFYHNQKLKEVVIPDGVEEVCKNAFLMCDSLTSVTLPSKITYLAPGVFASCKKLTTVNNIPAGITSIGEEAFLETALTSFTIPEKCVEIQSSAFAGSQIASFTVADGNTAIKKIGEALYSTDMRLLYAYPPMAAADAVTVADGCAGIQAGAFYGAQVKKVTLPASVIAVDYMAFCKSILEDIVYSDNLAYIGEQAFAGTNLTSVKLPQALRYLQSATFADCFKLTSVTVGSNVNQMGIRQFYRCTELKELHFLGAKAPSVDYWEYTSEAPFFKIADKAVTLSCPKGCSASYTAEFKDYSAIGSIVDTETGVVAATSVAPATDAEVSVFDKITLNFADDMTMITSNPALKVICGSIVSGIPVGKEITVGMWKMFATDKKAPYIVPLDEYGEGGEPINMEAGKDYYVIIPRGILKTADGSINEEITVHYKGTWEEPQFMPSAIEPADGTSMSRLENVYLTFDAKPTKYNTSNSKIKLIEGELVDGVPTGTETMGYADQWWINISGNKVQIFPADYDAFLTPIDFKNDKDYFLVVGAKAFSNNGAYNKDIIIHYSGLTSGVGKVIAADAYTVKNGDALSVCIAGDAAADITVYNAAGVAVGTAAGVADAATFEGLASGLYIVKIASGKTVKTIKVVM